MARNKVLERAKVSISSGRAPFDLSQEGSITSMCGEIDVPYWQPIVKGTKGSVNRSVIITRTADVVSPAFHRVTEHFDFFLVPIHSLWRSWENWKLNINDLQDTNLVQWSDVQNTPNLTLPNNCPRMDFMGFIPKLFGTTESAANARAMNDALRFADWFGYNPGKCAQSDGINSMVMNLFAAGAYQKCYFEHYRNTAYESNNPYAYNFDWLYPDDSGLVQLIPSKPKHLAVAKEWFKVRRVNMRNDYFHNIYPALNYVSSSPSGVGFSVPSSVGGVASGSPLSNFPAVSSGSSPFSPYIYQSAGNMSSNSQYLSVQSIRAAFALDKLMRASAYAPKHVKEQYKAQFGVDGHVYDSDMRSQRLGSFQSNVVFQEVTNMAESSDAKLGDLGAKGLGSSQGDKPISFYAEYDSILICLHYFLPRSRYDADGIFEWNTHISRESFFIKAFENLGLRPFYIRNLNGSLVTTFAWTVPNFEYKIKPDVNHGEFKQIFITYEYESAADPGERLYLNTQMSDQLSTFVPHTLNNYPLTVIGYTADYFKVSPEDLDNIFRNQVPAHHPIGFYQFYTDYRISVPVVAPMSVHGQPSL